MALKNANPFAKIGIYGPQGSGKTRLAAELSIAMIKTFDLKPVVFVQDTERAQSALQDLYKQNGISCEFNPSRTLADTRLFIEYAIQEKGILIQDSVTHVWETLIDDYLRAQEKDYYRRKGKKKKLTLSLQDWGALKREWRENFADLYVTGAFHGIICGRQAFDYEYTTNEAGKTELRKSGEKMKVGGELMYEPHILIHCDQYQESNLDGGFDHYHKYFIQKDRTGKNHMKLVDKRYLKFGDIKESIKILVRGKISDLPAPTPTEFNIINENWSEAKKTREFIVNEVRGMFNLFGLGTARMHVKFKAYILDQYFRITSIDNLDNLEYQQLVDGFECLKIFAHKFLPYLHRLTEEKAKDFDPVEAKRLVDESGNEFDQGGRVELKEVKEIPKPEIIGTDEKI